MASYGYCRVSGGDQNLARQTDALQSYGISPEHIFAAKQSGKDFERAEYKKLLSVLKEGDLVAVLSLDRLGRNYEQILAEWEHITRNIKADIIVLDMPLLDARARADTLVENLLPTWYCKCFPLLRRTSAAISGLVRRRAFVWQKSAA